MKALFDAMCRDGAMKRIIESWHKTSGKTLIYGLAGTQKHAAIAAAWQSDPGVLAIIVHDRTSLASWRADLSEMLPDAIIEELPQLDISAIQSVATSMERMAWRMEVLGRIDTGEPVIILAVADSAVQRDISPVKFRDISLKLQPGDIMERDQLLHKLVALGYSREDEVENIGQFSARGGIVDIYPITAEHPVRLEFFDDEIDSLREFDEETRRSIRNIDSVKVLPVLPEDGSKEASFLSYISDGAVLFDEPARLREEMRKLIKEEPELRKKIFSWEELLGTAPARRFFSTLILQRIHGDNPDETISLAAKAVAPYQRQMDLFRSEMKSYLDQNQQVAVYLGNREKAESMHELLARSRVPSSVRNDEDGIDLRFINILVGTIENGFELPEANLIVIAEKDIFGRQRRRRSNKVPAGQKISHFRDIKEGDYVVHINHGIGKYLGVVTMDVGGIKRDYLNIKYGGDDKLYVPTDQVSMLQKYIGSEGETPRLHRMGGTEWAKAKARARHAVEDIAKDLLALYAKRSEAKGYAFPPDTPWQREFEDAFPYEETEDQLRAIDEIKADMEKQQPMDRLLCGDVGFGKTEVAIRAAFKAVMAGKQVAVLVPTTVLAQQHYQTFSSRFNDFGPVVDVICRFRTPKEQKQTLQETEAGHVDILIGTHALLNQKRVHFKDLGLLIVDEEQRFGVKQKEKIKKVSAGIDVLTLSATPIPRTLHMSLAGARDMSVIETPPAERFPVQTYVVESNPDILAAAIKRELKRGGQVYFVYNRVATIDKMRSRLEELVPEARIMTAHGQMPEDMLEQVMMDFYEDRYDILLATSIVENGLDVANANTIIVYNADHFGLSQLYQMRGRVGRSNHMAFAYFVYQADKVLSETAEKRLEAMKEFAQLGAGFKIAMRDLEIRGAGDLLGAQQHGHIASVGFEMYCKLLDEAVQKLRMGKPVEPDPEPVIELPIDAYIADSYISDAAHKMEIYKRIAAIRSDEDADSLLDELIDRFGEPGESVLCLLAVARIRNRARRIGIKTISMHKGIVDFIFCNKAMYEPDDLAKLIKMYGKRLRILMSPDQRIQVRLMKMESKDLAGFVLDFLRVLGGESEGMKTNKHTVKEVI